MFKDNFYMYIYILPYIIFLDPLWSNISQQWANMASVPNNLNFTESDIEKLLSLSNHGKSSVLLASGRINYDRKNNVICIPEPSE